MRSAPSSSGPACPAAPSTAPSSPPSSPPPHRHRRLCIWFWPRIHMHSLLCPVAAASSAGLQLGHSGAVDLEHSGTHTVGIPNDIRVREPEDDPAERSHLPIPGEVAAAVL